MARLGRRHPQQSRLRKPAAIGPAVVFRAVRVWLAQPYLPGQHVTEREARTKYRAPSTIAAPVVFRALKVVLSGLQLPQQILTRHGTSYKLQAPAVVSTPAPPFVADPVKVRAVAVFVLQAAGGQRRSPMAKLNAPAVVATAATFGAVKVTTVDQPRRYQHAASKLQAPTVIGAAAAQFVADPIRAKLTKRPPNYIRVKPALRPPTVVDPQVVTTVPYPVRVKLVPQPGGLRHANSELRPPTAIAPSVTFRPLEVSFTRAIDTRTDYRRREPVYRLRPPTVVDPAVAATVSKTIFGTHTPSAATLRGTPAARGFNDPSPGASDFGPPSPGADIAGGDPIFGGVGDYLGDE